MESNKLAETTVNENDNCAPLGSLQSKIDGVNSCLDTETIKDISEKLNLSDYLEPVELPKTHMSDVVNLVTVVQKPFINRAKAIEKLKKATGCGNTEGDTCIINKVPDSSLVAERVFKPEGTINATDWLSNTNIDQVLTQYEDLSRFLSNLGKYEHLNYHMIDFMNPPPKYKYPLTGTTVYDLILAKGYDCFGTVLNTDKSSGGGQHWFAMFGDFRDPKKYTLEIYNCAGGPMDINLQGWMHQQAAIIKQKTGIECSVENVTLDVVHQRDTYSCGIYSIFYIIKRLEKHPYTEFKKVGSVNDQMIHEFRKKIYKK